VFSYLLRVLAHHATAHLHFRGGDRHFVSEDLVLASVEGVLGQGRLVVGFGDCETPFFFSFFSFF